MAGLNNKTSQYGRTKIRDFYLDIHEPITIPKSIYDREYVIESKYHQRPDLLANDEYGTPGLWWIFAQTNKNVLLDPIFDFTAGTTITIPSRKTVERSL